MVAYRPVMAGQPSRLRVAHPDRDEDRGQDQTGEDVVGQPGRAVGPDDVDGRDVAIPRPVG